MDKIRVTSPADLITALPSILGFTPTRSVVLVCMTGVDAKRVGTVMRVDLPDPNELFDADATPIESIAAHCDRHTVPAVEIVVVEDRFPKGWTPHQEFIRTLRRTLAKAGTAVRDPRFTPTIVAGARWGTYGSSAGGMLADPNTSAVAAAHVVAGRVIHADRAELVSTFAPDPVDLPGLRAALTDAEATTGSASVQYATVLSVLDLYSLSGTALTVTDLTNVGVALMNLTVRDACFGLAIGDHADLVGRLWVYLTRVLPAPMRAEAAVLAANSFYLRGEGPLAGEALDVALSCVPNHRMATLLRTALQGGLTPGQLRSLSETGARAAAEGLTAPAAAGIAVAR